MAAASTTGHLAGRDVRVSNLKRPYWPKDGLTKGDMLTYYRDLAPVMLPYFADRPVTPRIYPRGIESTSYYRRERPEQAPGWLRGAPYQTVTNQHEIQVLLVDDAAGLIWLANTGAIELHLWGARLPSLDAPDQAIFDLDPGEAATFVDVLRAALLLGELLDRLGVRAYPKTTGGRGLHVFLPLEPGHTFEQVRDWVRSVAERLSREHPDLLAIARGATHRGKRITVDHAQNSIGRNTGAPYMLRARAGAPVSTPLTWAEIAAGKVRPLDFTLRTVPDRLQKLGDLFMPVLGHDQRLPPL
jgi:bifunctional non-homologous end joining protein LigD